MKRTEIEALFDRFNELTVLVVGDVMIDAYFWGKVERISPEAPVPVVHVEKIESRLGGAANVALNVKNLGGKAIICSVVGDGTKGDVFRKSARDSGFLTEGIVDSVDRMTTKKTRVISGGHHIVRIDEEITWPLSATDERNLLECIRQIFSKQKVDAIIFEDYNKGVLTPKVIQTVTEWALEKGIPTAVDPKKDHFFSYENTTLFKPNFKELKEGLKSDIAKSDLDGLRTALQEICNRMNIRTTMVTLSELGIAFLDDGEFNHFGAHPREILDVSGAGDTVIAVAAMALACGWKAKDYAPLANIAGGLVCERVGVVPVEKDKLMEEAVRLLAD
jgi:rfaE bifunctional protein kinase chain/domain